jgi:flagellar hook-basal body complex protein FliE
LRAKSKRREENVKVEALRNPYPEWDIALTPSGRDRGIAVDSKDSFNPLKESMDQVNQVQLRGEKSLEDFSVGEADSIHKVIIDMEESLMSLKFAVQVRNKAVEAYQEIMRMQM